MTFTPMDARHLTREQNRGDLRALILIQEMICGNIKGQSCANGRKQGEGSKKSDENSQTASTGAIIIKSSINATERRGVAIVDAPGDFITANMDEYILLVLDSDITEIM